MEIKPNYFSIIPATVRYDNELKDKAKLLFSEITCLTNSLGYCIASNDYFANLYGVSKETISRLINQLAEKEYIKITYEKRGSQITKRMIILSSDIQNCQRSVDENVIRSVDENVKDNNTSINNNIINNIVHQDAPLTLSKKDINGAFEELWALYPSKKGKANITDSKKKELYSYGIEHIKRAIQRYIAYVEQTRKSKFALEYKNGSTFFNKGYVDYLDENYVAEPIKNVPSNNNNKLNIKGNKFHNFEQTISEYSEKEMEEIAQRNLEKKLKKLGITNTGGTYESRN